MCVHGIKTVGKHVSIWRQQFANVFAACFCARALIWLLYKYMLKDACLKEISRNSNRAEIGVSLFTVQVSYWKWNSEKTYEEKIIFCRCFIAILPWLWAWTRLYTQELLLYSIVRINEERFSIKSDSKALSSDILHWYPSIIESQWCRLTVRLSQLLSWSIIFLRQSNLQSLVILNALHTLALYYARPVVK